MINARITNTALGYIVGANDGQGVGLGLAILVSAGDKEYQLGPVSLEDTKTIEMILTMAEAITWDSLIGKVIRIDVNDGSIIRLANITNDEMYIDLTYGGEDEDGETEIATDKVEE